MVCLDTKCPASWAVDLASEAPWKLRLKQRRQREKHEQQTLCYCEASVLSPLSLTFDLLGIPRWSHSCIGLPSLITLLHWTPVHLQSSRNSKISLLVHAHLEILVRIEPHRMSTTPVVLDYNIIQYSKASTSSRISLPHLDRSWSHSRFHCDPTSRRRPLMRGSGCLQRHCRPTIRPGGICAHDYSYETPFYLWNKRMECQLHQ